MLSQRLMGIVHKTQHQRQLTSTTALLLTVMLVVLLTVMVVQLVLVVVLCVAGVASQAVAVPCPRPPIWKNSYWWTVVANAIDATSASYTAWSF